MNKDKPLTTAEASAAFSAALLRLVADVFGALRMRRTEQGYRDWAERKESERSEIRAETTRRLEQG